MNPRREIAQVLMMDTKTAPIRVIDRISGGVNDAIPRGGTRARTAAVEKAFSHPPIPQVMIIHVE